MALLSLQTLLIFLLTTILACVLDHVRQHWRFYSLILLIPNNKDSRFLGYGFAYVGMEQVTKQIIKIYEKSRSLPLFKVWLGPYFMVLPTDPDAVDKILVENLDKSAIYERMSGASGQGLIQHTHLPRWRKHRKIIGTSFQYSALQSYVRDFCQEATILADKMAHLAISKEPFEPNRLVGLASLNVLMRSVFGVDFEIQQNYYSHHPYLEAVDSAFEIFNTRLCKPWLLINFFYKMSGLKSKNAQNRKIQREFIMNTMDKIRSELGDSSSDPSMSFAQRVLRHNIESPDPRPEEMSNKELLHEMVALLNAGFDTLMITISVVLNILAIHPRIQEDVFRELENVFGEDDAVPTYDQLQNLDLLTRVIKEVMRLYPAGPFIARSSPTEVQCGDYIIPPGTIMTIFIYGIHRDPRYWPDPERFDPDRFLPSEVAKRNPNAYLPFSLGKRNCIGSKYAMLQIKITISTLLRRYRILPGDKCRSLQDIRFMFGMTIKLLPGNDIRIEPRKR